MIPPGPTAPAPRDRSTSATGAWMRLGRLRSRLAAGAWCAVVAVMPAPSAAQPSVPPAALPLPVLAAQTAQARVVTLEGLRGKVVLVVFWSTGCAVCLDTLPELRRNLAGWRGRPFEVIAVSQDRSMAEVKAYEQVLDRVAARDPQMHIVWRGDPAHRDSFGEQPLRMLTSVLINRSGEAVRTVSGRMPPELWNDIAELVLN